MEPIDKIFDVIKKTSRVLINEVRIDLGDCSYEDFRSYLDFCQKIEDRLGIKHEFKIESIDQDMEDK